MGLKKKAGMGLFEKVVLGVSMALLLMSIYARNSVDQVADDVAEMVQTAEHVESTNTLRDILITLNYQFSSAESGWQGALDFLMFMVLLASVLVVVLLVRCHKLSKALDAIQKKQGSE